MKNYANQNHYEILGVSRTATKEEIQKAYRLLAKLNRSGLSSNGSNAHEKGIQLNLAYEILSDTKKRSEFDSLNKERSTSNPNHGQKSNFSNSKNEFIKAYTKWEGESTHTAADVYDYTVREKGLNYANRLTDTYKQIHNCCDRMRGYGLNSLISRYTKCSEYYANDVVYNRQARNAAISFISDTMTCNLIQKDTFAKIFIAGGEAAIRSTMQIFELALN